SGEQPAGQKPGEGAQAAAGKYQPTDPNAEDPVGGDDEPADEDEEEDEPADPMPKIQEECMQTKECAPAKHHYDECAERVLKQMEEGDGKAKEDCVEEFFHLAHCASQCAAPKLFKQLK
ncbi:hypothetical protein LTS18_003697, partial [Coniosporium uncinatum]